MHKLTIILSLVVSFAIASPVLAANSTSASNNNSVKHVVKANETLSGISSLYHTSVQHIINLNKLSNPDKLQIGQVLLIFEAPNSGTTGVANSNSGNTGTNEVTKEKYIVKSGDTLTSISKLKGVTIQEIVAANKLTNPNALQIGQSLFIPVSKQSQALASRKDTRTHEDMGGNVSNDNSTSTDLAEEIIDYAKEFLGYPYAYSASGPGSFDCSGFTSYVYGHFDIDLPHNSASQASKGDYVNQDDLIPGDLVFFKTSGSGISHVGIYIGKNSFIHASTGGRKVEISSLSEVYYQKRYVTARRIL